MTVTMYKTHKDCEKQPILLFEMPFGNLCWEKNAIEQQNHSSKIVAD